MAKTPKGMEGGTGVSEEEGQEEQEQGRGIRRKNERTGHTAPAPSTTAFSAASTPSNVTFTEILTDDKAGYEEETEGGFGSASVTAVGANFLSHLARPQIAPSGRASTEPPRSSSPASEPSLRESYERADISGPFWLVRLDDSSSMMFKNFACAKRVFDRSLGSGYYPEILKAVGLVNPMDNLLRKTPRETVFYGVKSRDSAHWFLTRAAAQRCFLAECAVYSYTSVVISTNSTRTWSYLQDTDFYSFTY
ncbi:hypothetical protein ONZ45_g7562 [Pleurotus djamor]|nr:hypothetical protein ONZ45_g7562 [Pleurotus djamor]